MNSIVLAVIVMMALSLVRVPVILALIIATFAGGMSAGMSVGDVIVAFEGGLGNDATIALSYALLGAFAVALSRSGITHLLAQRIAFTGQYNQAQSRNMAADWVAKGYCAESMASAESAAPGLRAAVTAALAEEGFNITEPLTQQAVALDQASKGFFGWLGKAFKAVGKALGGLFHAEGSGTYEYYENGNKKSCDRQWSVGFGSGGEAFEPTPFYPDPNPG